MGGFFLKGFQIFFQQNIEIPPQWVQRQTKEQLQAQRAFFLQLSQSSLDNQIKIVNRFKIFSHK